MSFSYTITNCCHFSLLKLQNNKTFLSYVTKSKSWGFLAKVYICSDISFLTWIDYIHVTKLFEDIISLPTTLWTIQITLFFKFLLTNHSLSYYKFLVNSFVKLIKLENGSHKTHSLQYVAITFPIINILINFSLSGDEKIFKIELKSAVNQGRNTTTANIICFFPPINSNKRGHRLLKVSITLIIWYSFKITMC